MESFKTGLYYYGARYYDPRTSVWQSPDPILGQYLTGKPNSGVYRSFNIALFTYTSQNPVKYIDPTGLVTSKSGDFNFGGIPKPPRGVLKGSKPIYNKSAILVGWHYRYTSGYHVYYDKNGKEIKTRQDKGGGLETKGLHILIAVLITMYAGRAAAGLAAENAARKNKKSANKSKKAWEKAKEARKKLKDSYKNKKKGTWDPKEVNKEISDENKRIDKINKDYIKDGKKQHDGLDDLWDQNDLPRKPNNKSNR